LDASADGAGSRGRASRVFAAATAAVTCVRASWRPRRVGRLAGARSPSTGSAPPEGGSAAAVERRFRLRFFL